MRKEQLLENVKSIKEVVKEIEEIDDKIDFYYSFPLTGHYATLTSAIFNLSLVTAMLTIGVIDWKLLLLSPVIFYFVRGSMLTNLMNKIAVKNKLKKYDQDINMLLKSKSEKLIQVTNMTLIEDRYFSTQALERFEFYLESKKAATLEKCVELYEKEKVS